MEPISKCSFSLTEQFNKLIYVNHARSQPMSFQEVKFLKTFGEPFSILLLIFISTKIIFKTKILKAVSERGGQKPNSIKNWNIADGSMLPWARHRFFN